MGFKKKKNFLKHVKTLKLKTFFFFLTLYNNYHNTAGKQWRNLLHDILTILEENECAEAEDKSRKHAIL